MFQLSFNVHFFCNCNFVFSFPLMFNHFHSFSLTRHPRLTEVRLTCISENRPRITVNHPQHTETEACSCIPNLVDMGSSESVSDFFRTDRKSGAPEAAMSTACYAAANDAKPAAINTSARNDSKFDEITLV